jgi:phosphoglycolate phosphatase
LINVIFPDRFRSNAVSRKNEAVILNHEFANIAEHFFQIYGGNSFEEKKPHPIGIERLVAESGADRERTVMVGDSAVDVLTARAASVKACGVPWGFQPETFATAPPDFIVDDLRVLAEMVLDGAWT